MTEVNNEFNHSDSVALGVSLRHYVDAQTDAQCRKCDLCRSDLDKQFITSVDATMLARDTVDREFKAITKATDLARENVERRMDAVDKRVDDLAWSKGNYVTLEDFNAKHDGVVEKVGALQLSEAALAGKASQKTVMIAIVFSCIAALGTVAGIVLAIALH